ncbi:MAG: polymer-forming cytoskeletal protein [candidate division Zixibacteria bacterium]|nr:polymer-forming cytoskeletal protein [candidate division Zixibacteria bacterium]
MIKTKLIWAFLSIILIFFLGGGFVSRSQSASIKEKAAEVKVEDGEVYIKTAEGKEVKISEEGSVSVGEESSQIQESTESQFEEGKKVIDKIIHVVGNEDIVIEENEVVKEDVVSVWGGNITVRGRVKGDVVAVRSKILVTSTGVIEGDAVSVGGGIEKEPGGVIQGEIVDSRFPLMGQGGLPHSHLLGWQPFHPVLAIRGLMLFARIIKIMIFLLLAIIVFAIVPKNVEKIKNKIDHDFWISFLVGLAVLLLIAPAFLILFVLLCITIIGIPVALIALPLAVAAYFLLAYTSGAYFLGNKLKEKTSIKPETPMMTLIVGVLAVEVVLLFARLIGIIGGPLVVLACIMAILGWVIFGVIITIGLGAGLLTRFGTRPKDAKPEEKPKETQDNSCSQPNNK